MMRWVQESHPEISLDRRIGFVIIRAVGALMIVLAIAIFVSMLPK
jgi:hypothetical protein